MEDRAPGESARVHVAHMRDRQAIEGGGQGANGDGHPADSELFQLPESDGSETDGEQLGREGGRGGEESAAAHSGVGRFEQPTVSRGVSRSDLANRPANKCNDCADRQERNQERQDQQMPKVNGRRHELGQMVPELGLPVSNHGEQAHELKAEEEAMKNPNPALESRSAQQAIRREPPDEIQQEKDGNDGRYDRHAGDTLVPATALSNECGLSVAAVSDRRERAHCRARTPELARYIVAMRYGRSETAATGKIFPPA